MNSSSKKIMVAAVLAAAVMVTSAWAGGDDFGAAGAAVNKSPDLEEMLTYAIQDEYLARAEYELIMEEYGSMRPFSNVMQAEVRHIGWVVELFAEYDFALPKDTAALHVVLPSTLKAAFETGVQAEIDNIAMYESFLARELPEDVREVFEQLKAGSESHLRAFSNNLRRYE